MSVGKKLVLIAVGYALSIAGGVAAVAVNELLIPDDIKETSGGMVAFGDMVLFVLAAGFLSLAPTWFAIKLAIERAPRVLLAAELLLGAIGPVSWLAVRWMAPGPSPRSLPEAVSGALGVLIAFGAIPRIVLGPVLLAIEGATFFLVRERLTRTLLTAAMLMDLVPLSMYAWHMFGAPPVSAPPQEGLEGARQGSKRVNLRRDHFVRTGRLNPNLLSRQTRSHAAGLRQQQTLESINTGQHSRRCPREGSFVADSAR